MESLTKFIKTYIRNLSVFYCKEPSATDEEIEKEIVEIEEFIIKIFKEEE